MEEGKHDAAIAEAMRGYGVIMVDVAGNSCIYRPIYGPYVRILPWWLKPYVLFVGPLYVFMKMDNPLRDYFL